MPVTIALAPHAPTREKVMRGGRPVPRSTARGPWRALFPTRLRWVNSPGAYGLDNPSLRAIGCPGHQMPPVSGTAVNKKKTHPAGQPLAADPPAPFTKREFLCEPIS